MTWTIEYNRSVKTLAIFNNIIVKLMNDDQSSIIKGVGIFINPNSYEDANIFQDEAIDDEDGFLQDSQLMINIETRKQEDILTIAGMLNGLPNIYSNQRPNHLYCVMNYDEYKNIKSCFDKLGGLIDGEKFNEAYEYVASRM